MIRRIICFGAPLAALFLGACANLGLVPTASQCPPVTVEEAVAALQPEPAPVAAPAPTPVEDATQSYDVRVDTPSGHLPDGRIIVGAIETIRLVETGLEYKARIDSGADTSSIDAQDVVIFERDGERWVRFTMRPVGTASPVTLEKPVVHFVRVNQTTSEEADRRPVVNLRLQLGPNEDMIKVGLTDRSSMTHAVLLGREYLLDRAVIDISRNHIQVLP